MDNGGDGDGRSSIFAGLVISLSEPRRRLAVLFPPTSASEATASIERESRDEDFLSRIVVYKSEKRLFLGIVENMSYEGVVNRPFLKIRNLLCLSQDSAPVPVRNAPEPGRPVYFASDEELRRFFPGDRVPDRGYLGRLKWTGFLLPLDFGRLAFGNTAILAGIRHGKSHLAALIAAQLFLMGKKVLVVDPGGDCVKTMGELKEGLGRVHVEISWSYFDSAHLREESGGMKAPQEYLFESSKGGALAIVDLSHPYWLNDAKRRLEWRQAVIWRLHQDLMNRALDLYAESKAPYGFQTCIILDEAHQFVPHHATGDEPAVSTLFSISTKEYRKYGLGHIFVDQSLKAISEDLQIQTYLLGATTTPADLGFLHERLGRGVVQAAQRTVGGTESPSWIVYGAAAPMTEIPWEIETIGPGELSFLARRASRS